jgi:predicted nuclease with TOPRIM domain
MTDKEKGATQNARQTLGRFHRFNLSQREDGVYVCEYDHHRSEDCNWRRLDVRDLRSLLDASTTLAGTVDSLSGRIAELQRENERLKELVEEWRDVGHRLRREYDREQEEHGFPFNFDLRDAHRDLLRMLKEAR